LERPLIQLERVEIRYAGSDGPPLVGPLDWSVAPGEVVAIVGPSGAGKTSLLNLIGGLDQPFAGTVRVGGLELNRLADEQLSHYRATQVGFVFQSFHLRSDRTVMDNILLPLYFQETPWAVGRERAEELLQGLDLAGFSGRPVRELSGGQRQRVALARALVHKPAVLLADEPVGNLDADTSALVISLLRAENKQRGLTIVLATHDAILLDLANRIDVLKAGKLLPSGEEVS
jgi:ABC-type lipoprotein export system ATPase subunit